MHSGTPGQDESERKEFCNHTFSILDKAQLQFLVGGAYAFGHYTDIRRDTKDLDIFVRPIDCARVLEALSQEGYQTELTDPVWLSKSFWKDHFIDIIFSSGNGVCTVDDAWFEHAASGEIFGVLVKLCPPEEMIWSKGYLMERERYDGADIAHLIAACGANFDWSRLLSRFDQHWRVLLSHIILFDFIYPTHSSQIPAWVRKELISRLDDENTDPGPRPKICRGPLLSREQYVIDIERFGYQRPGGQG